MAERFGTGFAGQLEGVFFTLYSHCEQRRGNPGADAMRRSLSTAATVCDVRNHTTHFSFSPEEKINKAQKALVPELNTISQQQPRVSGASAPRATPHAREV